MVKNEYYYVEDSQYSGFMIGQCLSNPKYSDNLIRGDSKAVLIATFGNENKFSNQGWCFKDYTRTYRLATQSEINWLKQCIKLNKFIEKPKTTNYELW